MTGGSAATRRRSADVFGNDKWIEVVGALNEMSGTPIAQEIARRLGINHDLVMKVLTRLESGQMVKRLPRSGGRRGPVPWEVQPSPIWHAMVDLCRKLAASVDNTG